jgi:putative transcriptional regulator
VKNSTVEKLDKEQTEQVEGKGVIIVKLDEVMLKRKVRLNELATRIDLTEANLSILKTGKAKAIRFSTLAALCAELNCQPGDILEFQQEEK